MNARNFPLTLQPGLWYDRGMQTLIQKQNNEAFLSLRVLVHIVLTFAARGLFLFLREVI